jgi:hypothetical protein
MNNLTPWSNVIKAPVSPLSEEIDALVDRGFLRYLRPCAPPGVELKMRRGVKTSDGKLPSTYAAGQWFGLPAWLTYEPKLADVLEWSTWPGAGLCLVTGNICAFDIDIKFDWNDQSEAAKRGRKCISAIIKAITTGTGHDAAITPLRGRKNSTSCAFFVRVSGRVEKQVVTLFDAGSDRKHKVEFLGFVKENGAMLSRATYSRLWAFAQASGNLVTEAQWMDGRYGGFSTGDLATTFRIPDSRGQFIRGWADNGSVDAGRLIYAVQFDELRSHTHTAPGYAGASTFGAGTGGVDTVGAHIDIVISSTGGTETRPRNIAKLACIKY